MPAFTKHEPDALVIQFDRDGESPQTALAPNGARALKVALLMLARLDFLLSGDRLTVRKAEDPSTKND